MKRFFLCFILLLTASQCFSKTILLNKVILPKKPDTYMEVRHIILKGSNIEIGEALGKIAQSWLNIYPASYTAPIYSMARNAYMLNNYPILYYRMKGIAKAYNSTYRDGQLDFSALPYDLGPFACSLVYYPSSTTKKGHSLIARTSDSCLASINELIGNQAYAADANLFSHNYILELYPTAGYSSIVFGSMDLVNGLFDGLNSTGLYVGCLNDDEAPTSNGPIGGDRRTGLYILQLARLLLDTCDTVQEAKIKILNTKISSIYRGIHMFAADRSGKSFIFEISPNNSIHFTDSDGQPQIMTQFPVFRYPRVSAFPELTSDSEKTNSFKRYIKLHNFVQSTKEKFTEKMAWDAMNQVYVNSSIMSGITHLRFPVRTIWKVFVDQDDLSCKIIYYLNDVELDKKTGGGTLNFSKPFKFKLGLTKEKLKKISAANNPEPQY